LAAKAAPPVPTRPKRASAAAPETAAAAAKAIAKQATEKSRNLWVLSIPSMV